MKDNMTPLIIVLRDVKNHFTIFKTPLLFQFPIFYYLNRRNITKPRLSKEGQPNYFKLLK